MGLTGKVCLATAIAVTAGGGITGAITLATGDHHGPAPAPLVHQGRGGGRPHHRAQITPRASSLVRDKRQSHFDRGSGVGHHGEIAAAATDGSALAAVTGAEVATTDADQQKSSTTVEQPSLVLEPAKGGTHRRSPEGGGLQSRGASHGRAAARHPDPADARSGTPDPDRAHRDTSADADARARGADVARGHRDPGDDASGPTRIPGHTASVPSTQSPATPGVGQPQHPTGSAPSAQNASPPPAALKLGLVPPAQPLAAAPAPWSRSD